MSLQLKPDVTAPGVDVLSSVPAHAFEVLDGTSMATPHVAGGVALLLQRHPTWTVQQVKSALASTGDEVHPTGRSGEVSVLRAGGGRIDLVRANRPLIFTNPTSVGWGLVRRGFSGTKQLSTADAGGGNAPWIVSIHQQSMPRGAKLEPQEKTLVAGSPLALRLTVSQTAAAGDGTGYVVLTRGADVRRVAFWFHVEIPRLGLDPQRILRGPGLYHGNTAGKASRVASYRYPQRGLAPGVPTRLGGPEQVFRFTLRRPVANFGAVVVRKARGIRVSPRLVAADDENRVVGYTGIPARLNPYEGFYRGEPVVGAVLPEPRTYEFVFDTPTRAKPGAFVFRFWVDDTSPPSIRHPRPQGQDRTADPRRGPRLRLRGRPAFPQSESRRQVGALQVRRGRAPAPDERPSPRQAGHDGHVPRITRRRRTWKTSDRCSRTPASSTPR